MKRHPWTGRLRSVSYTHLVLYPFLCDYRRVWELNCRGSAYEELEYFFRAYDPRHEQEEEYFTRLGYIDVQYLVPRIRAKVLWGMGCLLYTSCACAVGKKAVYRIIDSIDKGVDEEYQCEL